MYKTRVVDDEVLEMALKSAALCPSSDLNKELCKEILVYQVLAKLQGKCIPKLHFFLCLGVYDIVIVAQFIDQLIKIEELNQTKKCKIVNCLEKIHTRGVCHGDIEESNILTDGEKFFFVDFGCAKTCNSQKEFEVEMEALKLLLEKVYFY